MDGDRDRDPHRNTGLNFLGPNEKQKEREREQRRQDQREPSSDDGWRYRQRPTLEHRTEPPKDQMRSRRTKKMTKDCEGCYHSLIQGVRSNESLPKAVGLRLNKHVIQPDSLNVAGFSECGWPGVFLRSHGQ